MSMAKQQVFLNRRGFGEVMSSEALAQQLMPYAQEVVGQVPHASVTAVRTGVGSSNARVRLRVEAEASSRAELIAAARAAVGSATKR